MPCCYHPTVVFLKRKREALRDIRTSPSAHPHACRYPFVRSATVHGPVAGSQGGDAGPSSSCDTAGRLSSYSTPGLCPGGYGWASPAVTVAYTRAWTTPMWRAVLTDSTWLSFCGQLAVWTSGYCIRSLSMVLTRLVSLHWLGRKGLFFTRSFRHEGHVY